LGAMRKGRGALGTAGKAAPWMTFVV